MYWRPWDSRSTRDLMEKTWCVCYGFSRGATTVPWGTPPSPSHPEPYVITITVIDAYDDGLSVIETLCESQHGHCDLQTGVAQGAMLNQALLSRRMSRGDKHLYQSHLTRTAPQLSDDSPDQMPSRVNKCQIPTSIRRVSDTVKSYGCLVLTEGQCDHFTAHLLPPS